MVFKFQFIIFKVLYSKTAIHKYGKNEKMAENILTSTFVFKPNHEFQNLICVFKEFISSFLHFKQYLLIKIVSKIILNISNNFVILSWCRKLCLVLYVCAKFQKIWPSVRRLKRRTTFGFCNKNPLFLRKVLNS